MNFSNDCVYEFVFVDKRERLTYEEALEKYQQDGMVANTSAREELQGQPKFSGFLGAMYNGVENGKTIIRYETQEAYNMYSC